MTLDLDLTPQAETWLIREAQHRGVHPAAVIKRVIEEHAVSVANPVAFKTPQERIRAMNALAESFTDPPHVTDDAFDRELIYEDAI